MSELGAVLTGVGLVQLRTDERLGAADAYGGAMLTVSGLLALLSAQESERGVAWRMADIAAMRALLAAGGVAAPDSATGYTLSELDAAWASLSDALVAHHALVEAAGDAAQDAAICAFYRDSCRRRELKWPM